MTIDQSARLRKSRNALAPSLFCRAAGNGKLFTLVKQPRFKISTFAITRSHRKTVQTKTFWALIQLQPDRSGFTSWGIELSLFSLPILLLCSGKMEKEKMKSPDPRLFSSSSHRLLADVVSISCQGLRRLKKKK